MERTAQLKHQVRKMLHGLGYDLVGVATTPAVRRAKMIAFNRISALVDVGGNRGGYGQEVRGSGYAGPIHSFEPVASTFRMLQESAKGDPRWRTYQKAAGAEHGFVPINVTSGVGESSSLLPMTEAHTSNAPGIQNVATEQIEVVSLDDFLLPELRPDDRLLLKIDTQGYEGQVLSGAMRLLEQVHLLECELSFVPLYDGQPLFPEMLERIHRLGFQPVSFQPGFLAVDSGYCLQVDGMFARS